MKVQVEAQVEPWAAPKQVLLDGVFGVPLQSVNQTIIQKLCHLWLDEVCRNTGMTYDLVFEIREESEEIVTNE